MRLLTLAVVPAADLGLVTPRMRTLAERERALRSALFLACLIGLAGGHLFSAAYRVTPLEGPKIIDHYGPVVDDAPVVEDAPGPVHDSGNQDDGTVVPGDLDTLQADVDESVDLSGFTGEDGVGNIVSGGVSNGVPQGNGREELPEPETFVYFDEPPVEISKVLPEYPEPARQARMEGLVLLKVLVDRDGSVRDVRVTRSSGLFDEAAASAVRRWKFRPALSNGSPVAVWIAIPVRFTLH